MPKTAAIELFAHRNIVGAVQHQMVLGNQLIHFGIIQHPIDGFYLNMGIERTQALFGRFHFGLAYIAILVQYLALQVGQFDTVEVHQGQLADPGNRQILTGSAA
ncbi:MAG: hypothetical protein SStaBPW_08000 [Shewanella algae]